MSFAEKTFLGSLMKAEYLLKDTVVQPEQLESTRHQELMRRMVELKCAGKNIDVITMTTLPDLESFGGMYYLSELLSYADIEKFDGTRKTRGRIYCIIKRSVPVFIENYHRYCDFISSSCWR